MLKVNFIFDQSQLFIYWGKKHKGQKPSHRIIQENQEFKDLVEGKWKASELQVSSLFKKITGIKLQGNFDVFVLHPSLEIGHYVDERSVEWGYSELIKDYLVFGIAHELLHCLTHEFYVSLSEKDKWIFHAIVYLSMDEELRMELDSKGEYFDSPIVESYHKRLISTAKKLLPEWKKRMANEKKTDIFTFFESVKAKL